MPAMPAPSPVPPPVMKATLPRNVSLGNIGIFLAGNISQRFTERCDVDIRCTCNVRLHDPFICEQQWQQCTNYCMIPLHVNNNDNNAPTIVVVLGYDAEMPDSRTDLKPLYPLLPQMSET